MSVLNTKKDLTALFLQQVEATPNALALEDGSIKYTYAELAAKTAALADILRANGVHRDILVGVLLPRSADYVVACVAAMRAGGAFLVLELAYPREMLQDVLSDANPAVVVTYSSQLGKLGEEVKCIVLDEEKTLQNGTTHANGHSQTEYDDTDLEKLAFASYSSGTTGKPKGIANPHRAAVLSYDLRFGVSDLGPGDRVACNVFFVWEILRPLLRGATVITVPDETSYDPNMLVELLSAQRATETLMTPTLLAAVLSRHPRIVSRLPDLKTLWLNGEVVTTDLATRVKKALPNTRIMNLYSTSETHEIAWGDLADMTDHEATYCPVGPPIHPEHCHVLDENGKPVEAGAEGELYVGGDMLARGYINRPQTTAKAFLADRFHDSPGARIYRTGDTARLHTNGLLEITGRVGAMIKLRGYSIVPGKVESAITKNLGVKQCAIIANGDGLDRQLVAYVVRDEETSESRPAIEINESGHSPGARKAMAQHLAQYMIPALWVDMDVIPTHEVSGKVALDRLPAPPNRKTEAAAGPPVAKDPIGIDEVAEAWVNTLQVPRSAIQPDISFFDLGGHSLSLADLAGRLSRTFGFRVPVARLADPTTLSGHVHTLRAVRDGEIAEVQADLVSALRADSQLDNEIQPHGAKMTSLKTAETVLLTGATGFLGAFLLNDLLENTSAKIKCLVRFPEPSEADIPAGIARIRRNMIDYSLWRDSVMERVEILPGNLARKRLGLSPEAFKALAHDVQMIFHAAASVNLVYPYAALRNANVGGTREMLRLACEGGATMHYVSTNGVLPPSASGAGWPEDAMLYVDNVPEKLLDGYGQSKWAAEQLVYEAGRRGLPVRIYRVGTIGGHSSSGAANAWDLMTALFVESLQLGCAPEVEGWRAEMSPVDFVSRAMVHLANQTHAKQLVFHLGDPDPVDCSSVFDQFAKLGYPTERLGWEAWVEKWNQQRAPTKGGDGAFTVDVLRGGMPSVEFLRDIVVLNNAQTRPFRAQVERPKVDPILLETYTRHWFARGWLPRPPSAHAALGGSAQPIRKGILTGKVAVITGASSGIGAAAAAALVKEGAHVVLGARRLEALESVKRRLVVRESKVIVQRTDVTKQSDVEALMNTAEAELGPVDILVSCAGVMYYSMMKNAPSAMPQWEQTIDVNCKGLLHCLASTVPGMLERGSGHIVAISSDAGRKVFPGLGVYSGSKFFLEATLQVLRLETAGKGLRVTSIQPGNVSTDLLGMTTDSEAFKKYGEPSGAPILDADDVANSIVYALKQPEHVAVNEVLVEPRDEPM